MNFKKIALAAAAAAAATPAMAADLPVVAEPVNYVEACSVYGNGYFKLPGQDTCIRLHGRIRTNIESHDLTDGYDRAANAYSAYAKGYLYLESMTATELADIKTYMELESEWDDDSSASVGAGSAYVQFGFGDTNVLIGRSGSVFSAFGGYSEIGTIGPVSGGEDALQISATHSFGQGFTAAFGVMDSAANALAFDVVIPGEDDVAFTQAATKAANFEASLGYTQGMIAANLSVAAHAFNDFDFDAPMPNGLKDINKGLTGDVAYGYAVAGTIEADVTDNVKLGFGASYAHNALSYAGGFQDGLLVVESKDEAVKAYTLVAGMKVGLSDTLTGGLDVSYSDYDQGEYDADYTTINGSLTYAPVAGLAVVLDAGWGSLDTDGDDLDTAKVTGRVQYTF